MNKDYSVVKIGSGQHKVSVGDEIIIDRIDEKEGSRIKYDEVLLRVKKGKVEIGTPIVPDSSVSAEVIEHVRGRKNRYIKYKAKSRYRKHIGYRKSQTKIKITKIN